MKYDTIQQQMQEAARVSDMELHQMAEKFTKDILDSDPLFWGIEKRLSGYGTWKVKINFANEYHFGRDLAAALKADTDYIITHDEDAEFSLADFEDEINEVCYDLLSGYSEEETEGREMKTKKIEHYPNELHIEADNGEHYTINYEGLQGELTREEWKDDEVVSKFDQGSKDEILRALDMAYNGEFFKNSRKND